MGNETGKKKVEGNKMDGKNWASAVERARGNKEDGKMVDDDKENESTVRKMHDEKVQCDKDRRKT
jgi:hypothetical protein